ncbi:MAG: NUDIX domain-containing protein [Gammaproteobacteria bacterium]|nr:NUDIX domain-containing protein [Gammaproteobacteria bacterium]MDH4256288.1 NUDIX domain-containing protein [Gammaproteobacteria bacterium]MDH5311717.1 NUDIX domain-containing protein [Gammaproteobacteria bacterium]
MLPTDLTVAMLVEREGRYLIIKERVANALVLTQPGGHIESGESPEEAAIRETLEESGCEVAIRELLGVYLWIHPQTRQQFLRIMFVGDFLREMPDQRLDAGIVGVRWYEHAELKRRSRELRSPVVLRCIQDFEAGLRRPADMLRGMLPLQRNVHAVLASASLV